MRMPVLVVGVQEAERVERAEALRPRRVHDAARRQLPRGPGRAHRDRARGAGHRRPARRLQRPPSGGHRPGRAPAHDLRRRSAPAIRRCSRSPITSAPATWWSRLTPTASPRSWPNWSPRRARSAAGRASARRTKCRRSSRASKPASSTSATAAPASRSSATSCPARPCSSRCPAPASRCPWSASGRAELPRPSRWRAAWRCAATAAVDAQWRSFVDALELLPGYLPSPRPRPRRALLAAASGPVPRLRPRPAEYAEQSRKVRGSK